jgi:N-sulfoglucosamine sulfohydrolase
MQPNILFITCHDLGQHLGCYGQRSVRSESLDRLAGQGVLFENSFCTAPQCSPSRAALHTGRHAHSVGVLGLAHHPFNWHLKPDQMHLARRLQAAGYHTTLLGVQHVTSDRQAAGLGYDETFPVAPAPEIARTAQNILKAQAKVEQPFYLEVGFFEPHRPYNWGGAHPDDEQGVTLPGYIPPGSEAMADFAALQGMIHRMEQAVGVIMATLEENNLSDNTLVVFVTDHGLAMPRAKCTMYDPGISTTLLMRWPAGGVCGGRRYTELISHVDVVPTVLEAIGLPVPNDLHGRSFWPLLQGRPYQPNREIFTEKTFHTAYEPLRAIRTQNHKLILNLEVGLRFDVPGDVCQSPIYPLILDRLVGERPTLELYDLNEDPEEQVNLAGRPEVTEVEQALLGRLRQWMAETDDPLLLGPPASPFYQASRKLMDR